MSRKAAIGLTRIAVIVGAIVLLEILCRLKIINPLTLIPPSEMASSLWELMVSGQITADIVFEKFKLQSHVISLFATYGVTDHWDVNVLLPIVRTAIESGLQFTAHSVGDGAVHALLDVYEEINKDLPVRPTRPCITHAMQELRTLWICIRDARDVHH